MPSYHARPYCWEKNKFSQDSLKDNPILCPGCGQEISNEDVTEGIPLSLFVSIVRSGGSKLLPGLWNN